MKKILLFLLLVTTCSFAGEMDTKSSTAFFNPYERFGKKYYPILPEAAADYREVGIASWYGEDFHGLPTTTGEIYNMYDYTAAHKTLPLGLFVKVKNLENKKEVILRLNDRGPFVDGRIIDLSYAAAKDLDMVNKGTAKVELEVLGYPVYEGDRLTFRKPESYDAPFYRIQIGAFKVKENADRLAKTFTEKDVDVKVVEYMSKDGLFYRVRVGSFKKIEDAERYQKELKKIGFAKTFIVGD
ncbi:MAG: septal ring lytic transglycosylase RlpA family protein [bacterium]